MQPNLLLFLDISGGELIIILLAVFLIFGPKKLPEIARRMGRVINEIKHASGELTREFREETGNLAKELQQTRETIHRESEKLKSDFQQTTNAVRNGLETAPLNETPAAPEKLNIQESSSDTKQENEID
ncbi:MAG: twin-arginine translocase TatA/TatE family subunit [Lentimicrobium sp.]|jgi:TatA/E family protein of Tat protein translocase|nr:twin-arginine translocase TatA/TatE family subunit [Lentimicrobium sp.]MDY0025877.1 twin-arginine translocase TatA/TatE family subunit [Lentimicrobium sp.]